jgi:hypothetical protein
VHERPPAQVRVAVELALEIVEAQRLARDVVVFGLPGAGGS